MSQLSRSHSVQNKVLKIITFLILATIYYFYSEFSSLLNFSSRTEENKADSVEFIKKFAGNFRDIGPLSWEMVQNNCQNYDHTKHTTHLKLISFNKVSAGFAVPSSNTGFVMGAAEGYSRLINEALNSKVNDFYATQTIFKDLWELEDNSSVITTWKNISFSGKCYHLLEKIE